MHKTKIDITENVRAELVEHLNNRLADGMALAAQLKQAHWNVKGPNFIALHELFDKIHNDTREYVDLIAERITTLGGTAMGTVNVAAEKTALDPYPMDITKGEDHVEHVSKALAQFSKLVRETIEKADDLDDVVTEDVLTEVARGNDLNLWFVEAHAQA